MLIKARPFFPLNVLAMHSHAFMCVAAGQDGFCRANFVPQQIKLSSINVTLRRNSELRKMIVGFSFVNKKLLLTNVFSNLVTSDV